MTSKPFDSKTNDSNGKKDVYIWLWKKRKRESERKRVGFWVWNRLCHRRRGLCWFTYPRLLPPSIYYTRINEVYLKSSGVSGGQPRRLSSPSSFARSICLAEPYPFFFLRRDAPSLLPTPCAHLHRHMAGARTRMGRRSRAAAFVRRQAEAHHPEAVQQPVGLGQTSRFELLLALVEKDMASSWCCEETSLTIIPKKTWIEK